MTDAAAHDARLTTPDRVTMYGAAWCSDCRRSKALLDRLAVDYEYVDLEAVADGATRAEAISGRKSIPVIVFPNGRHVVEPSDAELTEELATAGVVEPVA
ncbi:glutaredoxin family protein [Curtobacterium sp. MCBD17_019]|uniref:glutaredoxin family protein n=1 Tax=Curtobacterium sp. MCBD17_019 TaxID=2175669 RepID=UPI0015E8A6DE|nr:glutaredoxin family protein [Curtobacterium sp. MCBD17_019]